MWTANWGVIYDEGDIRHDTPAACHSGFCPNYHKAPVLFNLTCRTYPKTCKNKEARMAFWRWLFGPWTPYKFVLDGYVNAPEVVDQCGYILTTHGSAPMNLVYNFLIAARFPTEHGYALDQWWTWVQAGVHPGLAYWATYAFGMRNPNPNHQSFDWARVSDDYVRNLCNGVIANPMHKKFPCNGVWGDQQCKSTGRSGNSTVGPDPIHPSWARRYPELCGEVPVLDPEYCYETNRYITKTTQQVLGINAVTLLLKEQERLGLETSHPQVREQAPTPA